MATTQPALGVLNRALTSVSVINFPNLNVTTGFFGTKVARISFEVETSDYIPVLAGNVPSPRLTQIITCMMYLNKSQSLAAAWEAQRLTSAIIGDVVVVTDSAVMPTYYMANATLQNIADLDLTGDSNDFPVMLKGTYYINNSIY